MKRQLSLFLDLDVFKLAERPIDPTSTGHNPTMNDPQCSNCHTVIDPVAGVFQHWDDQGSFSLREAWYRDMRAPSFIHEELPFEERGAEDSRFERSMTRLMYQALIGNDLLTAQNDNEYRAARERAFDVEQRFVDQVAEDFRSNGHNLKWIIKKLTRNPYFCATDLALENVLSEIEADTDTASPSIHRTCPGAWSLMTGQDLPGEQQVVQEPRFVNRAWSGVISVLWNGLGFLRMTAAAFR